VERGRGISRKKTIMVAVGQRILRTEGKDQRENQNCQGEPGRQMQEMRTEKGTKRTVWGARVGCWIH